MLFFSLSFSASTLSGVSPSLIFPPIYQGTNFASLPLVGFSRGTPVAVYMYFDGSNYTVQSSVFNLTTLTWGSPVQLSTPGVDASNLQIAAATVGGGGFTTTAPALGSNAVAAWTVSDGTNTRIQLAAATGGSLIGSVNWVVFPQYFSPPGVDVYQINFVFGRSGRGGEGGGFLIGWSTYDCRTSPCTFSLYSSLYTLLYNPTTPYITPTTPTTPYPDMFIYTP